MSRGGPRTGAGRPKGSRSVGTAALLQALEAAPPADLMRQLSDLAEDPARPTEARLEALRRLFGWFAARTALAPAPIPIKDA
jgi:hypothetical protein